MCVYTRQVRDLVAKCVESSVELDSTFMQRLSKSLVVQVMDPRSQVVKEVCTIITAVAGSLPLQFSAEEV